MSEMNEATKLGMAIMKLITADERLSTADPEAVAIAMAALAANVAGVMSGVILKKGDDTGRAVGERFAAKVNEEINGILDRTDCLLAEVNFTRH